MRRTSPTRAATATSASPSIASTRGEVVGVDELEVLGLDLKLLHRGARERARSRLASRSPPATASSAASQRPASARARARGRRRAAGRCGSTARGRRARARWGGDLDAHGDVEVAHELADHQRLLGVLLAEVRDVGPDHVQQLGHDGRDAVEVLGAAVRALERLGERAADADLGREARRVDLRGRARRGCRRRPPAPARRRAPRRAGRRRGRRRRRTATG